MSELTVQQKSQKIQVQKNLNIMANEIKTALPKHMDSARFSRIVMTAVSRSPKLLECDQNSFFGCLLLSAQLGMEPNGPDQKAFLIPFGKECQFIMGYKGLLELCRRSGELSSIHAEIAYENDELEVILGIDPTIIHKPNLKGDRGEVVLAYSVARFKDGSKDFAWMTKSEIDRVRESSKSKNSPAWIQWWTEMAKKTVLKRHLKTLPMNAEIQNFIDNDESFKKTIREDMTEMAEGESEAETKVLEEAQAKRATHADKAQFYDAVTKKGLAHLITAEETLKINGGCDFEWLSNLSKNELPNRKSKSMLGETAATAATEEDKLC